MCSRLAELDEKMIMLRETIRRGETVEELI